MHKLLFFLPKSVSLRDFYVVKSAICIVICVRNLVSFWYSLCEMKWNEMHFMQIMWKRSSRLQVGFSLSICNGKVISMQWKKEKKRNVFFGWSYSFKEKIVKFSSFKFNEIFLFQLSPKHCKAKPFMFYWKFVVWDWAQFGY